MRYIICIALLHVIYITIFYIICIIILHIIYIITCIYTYYKRSYADAVRYDNTSTNTTDLSKIYCELLACEKSNSSNSGTCPFDICTNSTEVSNSSNSQISQNNGNVFFSQDEELLSILQDLQQNLSSETNSSSKRIGGYFCSDTVFNLSSKILTDTEINILEKGLDFAPIQNKINKPDLRKDFEEFCRRMRIKWYFHYEISENVSEKPAFTPKSKWKPPKGHPSLEIFLSQIEKELFELAESPLN